MSQKLSVRVMLILLSGFVLQGQNCESITGGLPPVVDTPEAPIVPLLPRAAVLVQSTFDVDNEGWAVTNNQANINPIWAPEGGRPGGCIKMTDAKSGRRHEWYWDAPPKFLGDLSRAYGGTLSFDLGHENATSADNSRDPIVVLTGAGSVIVVPLPYKPGSSWTSYSFRLNPAAGWVHQDSGSAATEQDIRAVLESLVQMQILGDYSSGLKTGQLDNVAITATSNE